jgi:exonuclease III
MCCSMPHGRLRTKCNDFETAFVRRPRWLAYVVYIAIVIKLLSFPGCSFSWDVYHGNGHRIGEASNPGPRALNLCSMNVTSLRLHLAEVVGLEWDVASFQETGCSTTNIHNTQRLCHEYQIDMFHGPPISSEQSGGVAICSKSYHLIDTYSEHSENFSALVATKRWKHVAIPIVKNVVINLHNVYGYAGANSTSAAATNNEAFLQMVFLEAALGGDAPTIIMGDLNVEVAKSPTIQHAISNLGWIDVLDAFGNNSNTFHGTAEDFANNKGSRIDLVLANPTALALITSAGVLRQRLTGGHSPLLITIDGHKATLSGFRLDKLRSFSVPPVDRQSWL